MSLHARRRGTRAALALVFASAAVAAFFAGFNVGVCTFGPLLLLAWIGAGVVDAWLIRRATARLDAAIKRAGEVGGRSEPRRRYDDLATSVGAGWTESIDGQVALSTILLFERDYAAVCDVLGCVPLKELRPGARWEVLSNLAHATHHVGDVDRATELAEQALACAPAGTDGLDIVLTHVALGRAAKGRHEDAIELLEDASRRGGTAANRARTAFALGESLAALGRTEDARAAYTLACESAPRGRSARLARERLAQMTAYRDAVPGPRARIGPAEPGARAGAVEAGGEDEHEGVIEGTVTRSEERS